jgi:hypothetical protein
VTSRTFALGMASAAWLAALGVHWNNGYYTPAGLLLITAAIAVGCAACFAPPIRRLESVSNRVAFVVMAIAVVVEAALIRQRAAHDLVVMGSIAVLGLLGALQGLDLRSFRLPIVAVMVIAFWIAATASIRLFPPPHIDVLTFQQMGASALLNGENPYIDRYPNLYEANPEFYGPGVVDANNHLTVGLPYPPASLLLSLPGYALSGDSRYSDIAAIAGSAALMFLAAPGRWTGLTASLFLLMPRVIFLVEYAWTETIFAFTFSLVMFCALRWRRGLPYAFGLFLATKQYSVFALPLAPLLIGEAQWRRSVVRLVGMALAVAAVITLPFFFWNPQAFWRSIVVFQFLQPLREESLSHIVWMHKYLPQLPGQQVVPFVLLAATLAVAWWRRQPTPAYFAAAFGVAQLLFFAFSKQAFANYYYFVIATMWWGAAAAFGAFDERRACDAG